MKRIKSITWRVACFCGGIVAVSITILAALQSFVYAFNVHYYPPPGRLYDIGGSRSMHLNCNENGNGTVGPTIIFLHGWGGQAYDWSWIQPNVSVFAKTCSLDRAGYGWSDPPNCVLCGRTAEQQAKDLDSVLKVAGLAKDSIVFVAYGDAVLDTRVFVNTYKEYSVCGVVCVDCVDPAKFRKVGNHQKYDAPPFWDMWRNFLPSGIPGVLAASNRLPGFEVINTLPNAIHPVYVQNQLKPMYPQSVVREYESRPQSAYQANTAGTFGNIRFAVITAGKGFNATDVPSLSSNSSFSYLQKAPYAMHYHRAFAGTIIDQIRSVVFSGGIGCASLSSSHHVHY